MSGRIKHPDPAGNPSISSDCDVFSYRKRAVVSDASVVAYLQRRVVRVTRGEAETALSIDRDIVSEYNATSSLHPVQIYARMHVAPALLAVGFEKRFAEEHSQDEIANGPEKQGQPEYGIHDDARCWYAEIHKRAIRPTGQLSPLIL
jgi:hypothetical protein